MPTERRNDPFAGEDIANIPFSLEAEQSVLGAVIADSSCLLRVMEYVKAE